MSRKYNTLERFAIAALLAASLPAGADVPKPVCAPSPAQISVHWEIVNVPEADWNRLSLKSGAGQPTLQDALQKGHYRTVSSPTVTTTDGVEATVSTETQVPFGPPEKRGLVSIGTETKVKPHINRDGSVTLQFSLNDTELAGPAATPDDPPPTKSLCTTSTRTFRSGECANLGGTFVAHDKDAQVLLLTLTVKAAK